MDGWHADTGGVWTDRVSRSRRASGTPRPSPPRTPTPWTRACPPSALELTPEARAAIDGHARLLLAWTAAINLTAIREPGRGRGRSRRGQPDRRPSPPRPRGRPVHRPRVGRRLPGHPARGGAAERPDAASRADRQEGRGSCPSWPPRRAWRTRSRRRRSGRRPSPPIPAIAVAGRPSPPAPSRPWPTSSSSRSRCSSRAAASSPGSAATSARSWLPRTGPWPRSAGARWRSSAVVVPGLDGHKLVIATARGRSPAAYPRDPATRKRRPW